jgi:uncharacterized lipoprotein YddW (UPF0748 family)
MRCATWVFAWFTTLAAAPAQPSGYVPSVEIPPAVPREFRAAWIASVYNLDWPSAPGLPPATQRAELLRILDHAAALHLNALLLQIRPACDALYASPLEPWSPFLTGKMGRPPEPFYDPLEFAITEAHRRGLELHAWFNPYRAHTSSSGAPSSDHISRTRPTLIRSYNGMQWLDPGRPETLAHTRDVVLDVVRRYDIDGVHIDDYFYPYPDKKKTPFPDGATYAAYQRGGGRLTRAEWRRDNTNRMVQTLHQAIKGEKPWVKFGISPFGIWKTNHPSGIKSGIDAREDIFGDSLHWLKMGWLDYLAPQLYWTIDKPDQSFPRLLDWWRDQNSLQRHLWPGIAVDRVGRDRNATEILRQVGLTRRGAVPSAGHILWNFRPVLENRGGVGTRLKNESYQSPALPPAHPWLGSARPGAPRLSAARAEDGSWTFSWLTDPAGGSPPHRWVLQHREGTRWSTRILPGSVRHWTPERAPAALSVFAVDRIGNAGPAAILQSQP